MIYGKYRGKNTGPQCVKMDRLSIYFCNELTNAVFGPMFIDLSNAFIHVLMCIPHCRGALVACWITLKFCLICLYGLLQIYCENAQYKHQKKFSHLLLSNIQFIRTWIQQCVYICHCHGKYEQGLPFASGRIELECHYLRLVCNLIISIEIYADQTCSKCGDGRVEDLRWCISCLPWHICASRMCIYRNTSACQVLHESELSIYVVNRMSMCKEF
jgi:hypothetical protein